MDSVDESPDLRQQEQLFRALVEQSPDLIACFDRGLRHTYVNPALCRINNLNDEDFIGKTHRQLGMPDELVLLWEDAIEQVFQTDRETLIEYQSADGQRIFEARVLPELSKTGATEAVISFSRDITARRRAEAALVKNRDRLALVIEVTGLGIYEHAVPLDDHTFHSDRWAQILGYRLDELPPPAGRLEWVFQQIHPDDIEVISNAYTDFVAGRTQGYEVEIRMKHKSGEWVWVKGYSKATERNENGEVSRILGVMQDISSHKRIEATLTRQKELLQSIFDNVPVMMALFNPNGQPGLFNRTWQEKLGWSANDLNGNDGKLVEIFPDLEQQRLVNELMSTGKAGWHPLKARDRQGQSLDSL
ncbi:MAG: hypothetical protein Kow0031_39750 [Anaerolineae bacterium]